MMSRPNQKVMLVGATGQLGWELIRTRPENIELVSFDEIELNICDRPAVSETVKSITPSWIINAAAYTAVDAAESDEEIAFAVNSDGAFNLAIAAGEVKSRLVQLSTDFVFDGQTNKPYPFDAAPNPLSVYGRSKWSGEKKVLDALGCDALIIRTSWLYSAHGKNFVKTMLKLMDEKDQLNIVSDQIGTPTWAKGLAVAIWQAIDKELNGIHHWSDTGVASWYDFAVAIQDEGIRLGLLNKKIDIHPIATSEYPVPAKRPVYSVLNKTKTLRALDYKETHWRHALHNMMKEYATVDHL